MDICFLQIEITVVQDQVWVGTMDLRLEDQTTMIALHMLVTTQATIDQPITTTIAITMILVIDMQR